MGEAERKLTFEQCMRLVEALQGPSDGPVFQKNAQLIMDWAEKVLLDYWVLNQLLAGTILAGIDANGELSFMPKPGQTPIKLANWPPSIGKTPLLDVPASVSGLYKANWSGEHQAASLSGEHKVEWLKEHPEAAPRKRFNMG
jgi:hypothetical protein